MKKILLTIAIIGSSFIAFAQSTTTNTAEFIDATGGEQEFTFGKQTADTFSDHAEIITIDSGDGTSGDNNNYLSITGRAVEPNNNDSNTQATATFFLKTDVDINAVITVEFQTRLGNNVTGTMSIPGYTDTTFSYLSDGTVENILAVRELVFGSQVDLSSTPLEVTIVFDKIERQDVAAASLPTVRLQNVKIEKDGVLGIDSFNSLDTNKIVKITPSNIENEFSIEAENIDIESVKIYNIAGQLVKIFEKQNYYNVSNLSAGVYFVNINTAEGSKTIKVLKK